MEKELDAVFDIAMGIEGVIGSRMTGGGFGRCNISIVEKDKVEDFKIPWGRDIPGALGTRLPSINPIQEAAQRRYSVALMGRDRDEVYWDHAVACSLKRGNASFWWQSC